MCRQIFHTANDEEIKSGKTTDVYFRRTKEILERKRIKRKVTAEVTCGKFPKDWEWGVLSGVEEVARLFEGYPVDIDAIPEGSIFRCYDSRGVRIPIMNIRGDYKEFCELETPLLGFVCHASGVSTSAARIRKIIPDKQVISFGIRRMHPAISPVLDRAAFIGGFDGVSGILSAQLMGIKPVGTIPHALIITMGDQKRAWEAFDELMPDALPRIALCDTYYDEKAESIMAAEDISDLSAVRLDTPGSRRGNFPQIINEVRWELDIRGYKNVKIFVSGGLNEESIRILKDVPVDGFGVGTSVANAPTIDFAMNIIEINKRAVAKRGTFGGEKQVWRCPKCFSDLATLARERSPVCKKCRKKMQPLLKPLIRDGKIVGKLKPATEIRKRVLKDLKKVELG